MNTADDPQHDERLERLTAYLDGEADAAETSLIEERIANDPAWAAELRRLQRAWDLLDRLPKAEPDPDFTQTTVEMIALDAAAELEAVVRLRPVRKWIDRLLTVAAVAAVALSGFVAIDTLKPHRDDALLRELSLLKHFDVYARTEPGESADFARRLRDEHLKLVPVTKHVP